MDRFLVSDTPGSFGKSAYGGIDVDWMEDDDAHTFTIDVPGLKKQDVEVQFLGDDTLQISGKWRMERSKGKWNVKERPTGSFSRKFLLPGEVRPEKVIAYDADGVLSIKVPKKKLIRTIPITSAS